MRRREFITLMSGAAVWPLAARADEQRRIGVLMNRAEGDAEGLAAVAAFQQALQELGWSEGRNLRIDIRWGENDVDRERRYAADLVALSPEVILAPGTLSVGSIRNINRTLPIVFVTVSDPVGAGFVDSLAHPGGNTTGFMLLEYGSRREMVGTFETDRAATRASCGPSGSFQSRCRCRVRCHPSSRAICCG
jgi:putative ABC transport system substrate-binding protein